MKFEEDIKRWLTPAELSQLERAVRCLQDCQAGKVVDEKLKKDAEAQMDLFARTIADRKGMAVKRQEALAAIAPPFDDARRYLDKDEFKGFQDSVPGAIDAYLSPRLLDVESSWMLSPLAFNYEMWLSTIRSRREEEQRRRRALEAQLKAPEQAIRYSIELNAQIEKFCQRLHPEKEKLESVFSKLCTDPRHLGYNLTGLLAPEDREELGRAVLEWIRTRAVPGNLARFITYQCEVEYFPLLYAEYVKEDELPALDFMLESYAVVELGYWVQPATVKFNDIPVAVPMKVYDKYAVVMEAPEFLGYANYLLTPDDLTKAPCFFWQTIPLTLVESLMNGEPLPKGAVILDASAVDVSYEIAGQRFDIPNTFGDYLVAVRKHGGFLDLGIIPPKVAEVLQHLPPAPLGGPSKQVETGDKDLLAALLALGYTEAKVKEAIASTSFPENAGFEEKMKLLLQTLGGGS